MDAIRIHIEKHICTDACEEEVPDQSKDKWIYKQGTGTEHSGDCDHLSQAQGKLIETEMDRRWLGNLRRMMYACMHAKSLQSCPALFNSMDQASLSMGFSRQEYCQGLP